MKTLIIYDSNYGNTEKVAKAVEKELADDEAKVISITGLKDTDLEEVKLLIVGSPINGWRPTEKIRKFLSSFKTGQLKGISAASFDTRVDIFFHGDAAKTISQKLKDAGADVIVKPEGFFVEKGEGPLKEGEIERARTWADSIKHAYGRV